MSTDYASIYDHQIETNAGYRRGEYSPGFRIVLGHASLITPLAGRSLDVGCGVGFVVELLSNPPFNFESHGTDVSPTAIKHAQDRNNPNRISLCDGQTLPYADNEFDLVTCFDVLEHLNEHDVPYFCNELRRITRPGGLMLCSIALREAIAIDQFGENVHRTVRPFDWWAQYINPDEAHWTKNPMQAVCWYTK